MKQKGKTTTNLMGQQQWSTMTRQLKGTQRREMQGMVGRRRGRGSRN